MRYDPVGAFDWIGRTAVLALSVMATLAMMSSLASISGSTIGGLMPRAGEMAPGASTGDQPPPLLNEMASDDGNVLTNAAGGIRDGLRVGEPVLISDHLNLTARSPLAGAEFVDLVDAYSPELRDLARSVDPTLVEGVYAGVSGPQYETPAEIKMMRTIGADLVGMSTVHETIAARALGARVLGVSLVTNLAAGVTGEPLSHTEVLAEGRAAASRIGTLLRDVVSRL